MSTGPDAPMNAKDEVQLGPHGRVVIPAHLRKALDLRQGDKLVIHQVGQSIVLVRRAELVKRMQARFAGIDTGDSLADELIAERRSAAACEQGE